jgi:hypothetical protein
MEYADWVCSPSPEDLADEPLYVFHAAGRPWSWVQEANHKSYWRYPAGLHIGVKVIRMSPVSF